MNGVFDLGGTDGFGAVEHTAAEPAFHEEWERAVFGMQLACYPAGWLNIDSFRHGIEKMDPVTYLSSSYYEHWYHSVERNGIAKGGVDPVELDRRTQHYLDNPDAPLPEHRPIPELLDFVDQVVAFGAPAQRSRDEPPRFAVGDIVRVSTASPFGHTRMARYVRGKRATVMACRGAFVYPDSSGNERGEDPQHLYTIQFEGDELWGAGIAEPNTSSSFDAWEPYLEPVNHHEGARQ